MRYGMTWKIWLNIVLIAELGYVPPASGQSFSNRAELDSVKHTGFYAIPVRPELSRYIQADFRDLRIMDEKENVVPYMVRSTHPLFDSANYQPLKIIRNELFDSVSSIVVIENDPSQRIAFFSLQIRNAPVNRTIVLSGSNDLEHWNVIKENIQSVNATFTGNGTYFENIDFPERAYHYFRLLFQNGQEDPLQIITAGRFLKPPGKELISFAENPGLRWHQVDSSDHCSYVIVENPSLYQIDYVQIEVDGPGYFKRHGEILNAHVLGDFTIVSDSLFTFYLPVFKDSVWKIRIENGNNPPLQIKSLSSGIEVKKIITYLRAGSRYQMRMNSRDAALPEYDLESFRDHIPLDVSTIKISAVGHLTPEDVLKEPVFFKQIWALPIITVILFFLGYFTFNVLREGHERSEQVSAD